MKYLFVTLDLFIENGQNKAESYKIKIYNQFYTLKLFYLKNHKHFDQIRPKTTQWDTNRTRNN